MESRRSKVPSKVYKELFGCSHRHWPAREETSWGEIRLAVWGWDCLILRLVSLETTYISYGQNYENAN